LAKDEALMLTAKALMPDSLLDHIIDLVHHWLIKTVKILTLYYYLSSMCINFSSFEWPLGCCEYSLK
jgi:hypothetical protein